MQFRLKTVVTSVLPVALAMPSIAVAQSQLSEQPGASPPDTSAGSPASSSPEQQAPIVGESSSSLRVDEDVLLKVTQTHMAQRNYQAALSAAELVLREQRRQRIERSQFPRHGCCCLGAQPAFAVDCGHSASAKTRCLSDLPTQFDNPEFRQDAVRAVSKGVGRLNELITRLSTLRYPKAPNVPTRYVEFTYGDAGSAGSPGAKVIGTCTSVRGVGVGVVPATQGGCSSQRSPVPLRNEAPVEAQAVSAAAQRAAAAMRYVCVMGMVSSEVSDAGSTRG